MTTFTNRLKTGLSFLQQSFALIQANKVLYLYGLALASIALIFKFIIEPHTELNLKIIYSIVLMLVQAGIIWQTFAFLQGTKPGFYDMLRGIAPMILMIIIWGLVYEVGLSGLLTLQDLAIIKLFGYQYLNSWPAIITRIILAVFGITWILLTLYTLPAIVIDSMHIARALRQSCRVIRATWAEYLTGTVLMWSLVVLPSLLLVVLYSVFDVRHAWLLMGIQMCTVIIMMYVQLVLTVFLTFLYQWYINKPLPQTISY